MTILNNYIDSSSSRTPSPLSCISIDTVDDARLAKLVHNNVEGSLDLSQMTLYCSPHRVIDAIFALPHVILPTDLSSMQKQECTAYLLRKVAHCVFSVNQVFINTERKILLGTWKSTFQIVEALKQSVHKELCSQQKNPLQVACSFSIRLKVILVMTLYPHLLQLQTKYLGEQNRHIPNMKYLRLQAGNIFLQAINNVRARSINWNRLALDNCAEILEEAGKRLINQVSHIRGALVECSRIRIDLNLFLGRGICHGSTVSYLIKRLRHDPTYISMYPTPEARYLQPIQWRLSSLFSDERIENRFLDALDKFRKKSKRFFQEPSIDTFDQCNEAHFQVTQFATSSLGTYHLRRAYKARYLERQVVSPVSSLWNQIVLDMEKQCKDFENQLKSWHKESRIFYTDVRILRTKGVAFQQLSNEYIPAKDIPQHFLKLKEKVAHTKGHIYLAVCTERLTKNMFEGEDFLSLLFFETMINLAKKLRLKIENKNQRTHLLLSEFRILHEALSSSDRKLLCDIFVAKHMYQVSHECAKRIVGDAAPEEVISRVTISLGKKLQFKLHQFQLQATGVRFLFERHHAVYLKLTAPYELRDPNLPDCKLFKSDDFYEFLLYFSFWLMREKFTHLYGARLAVKP